MKTIFLPTEKSMTIEAIAPLIATLPLEVCLSFHLSLRDITMFACLRLSFLLGFFLMFQVRGVIGEFIQGVYSVFLGMFFVNCQANDFYFPTG